MFVKASASIAMVIYYKITSVFVTKINGSFVIPLGLLGFFPTASTQQSIVFVTIEELPIAINAGGV